MKSGNAVSGSIRIVGEPVHEGDQRSSHRQHRRIGQRQSPRGLKQHDGCDKQREQAFEEGHRGYVLTIQCSSVCSSIAASVERAARGFARRRSRAGVGAGRAA